MGELQAARRLQWDACENVRDVGGYRTIDGGRTRWRALVRADTLCRLTPQGCAALLDYGVGTIVDLRHPWELEVAPHPFAQPGSGRDGARYLNLPMSDPDDEDLQRALQVPARTHREANRITLDRCSDRVAAIVVAIAEAPDDAVLVHCHAGKDRTGLLVALVLALAGVPDGTIAEDYALSEVCLRERHDAELRGFTGDEAEKARIAELMGARPATILDTLAYLRDAHGGAHRYLRAAGLSAHQLERVRERLRE